MDNNNEIGDSSQEKYEECMVEESNELLKILVDAVTRGWRDTNGSFTKLTVINKILPAFNAKLGYQMTFSQYQIHMKWFKNRYNDYCKLLYHSSEFGWDPLTKKFTASDEVWDEYIKSNGNSNYRTDTFVDYEDLEIVIGNGTAIGRHAIGLGDDTDNRTLETEEMIGGGSSNNFMYDSSIGALIRSETQEPLYESSLLEQPIPPLHSQSMSLEVPTTRKRNRTNFEVLIDKVCHTIDKLTHIIDSIDGRNNTCWDLIKEIPNLDDSTRFMTLDLLNTRAKKFEFMKMTPEERFKWISYKLTK